MKSIENFDPINGIVIAASLLLIVTALDTTSFFTYDQAQASLLPNNFLTYQNPSYGISIQYPSIWKVQEGVTPSIIVVFGIPPPYQEESVGIEVNNFTSQGPDPLAQFSESNLHVHAKIPNFHIVQSSFISIAGGIPADRVVSTGTTTNGVPLKVLEIFAVKGDKGYTIRYIAEESKYPIYLPIVQKMIDTFKIAG